MASMEVAKWWGKAKPLFSKGKSDKSMENEHGLTNYHFEKGTSYNPLSREN
jgi:hypothetical protein